MKYLLLICLTLAAIAGRGQVVGNPALSKGNSYVADQWEQFIGGLDVIQDLQHRLDVLEKKVDSLEKMLEPGPLKTPGRLLINPKDSLFWRQKCQVLGTRAIEITSYPNEGTITIVKRDSL